MRLRHDVVEHREEGPAKLLAPRGLHGQAPRTNRTKFSTSHQNKYKYSYLASGRRRRRGAPDLYCTIVKYNYATLLLYNYLGKYYTFVGATFFHGINIPGPEHAPEQSFT
jgi:hypothetical protein